MAHGLVDSSVIHAVCYYYFILFTLLSVGHYLVTHITRPRAGAIYTVNLFSWQRDSKLCCFVGDIAIKDYYLLIVFSRCGA